jgi:ParB family transcriptional regulator, chromosome partitioning protein
MEANKRETTPVARRLGKGLSGLLNIQAPVVVAAQQGAALEPPSDVAQTKTSDDSNTKLSDVIAIPTGCIRTSPYQPRRTFSEQTLEELVRSIKSSGVMQPILVRPVVPAAGEIQYELIAGERRWRAAQRAGLAAIPAIVRELSNNTAAEWALVENVQREDLNPMDRAFALRSLLTNFGLTHDELAERLGLERSTISNLLRLASLETEIADLIVAGKLSGGHGKALLGIQNAGKRVDIARLAAQFGWSVRKVEKVAADIAQGVGGGASGATIAASSEASPRQAVLRDLERQIGAHLGTKVQIQTDPAGKRGRLVIEFYGLDHFDGVVTKLGFSAMG